jgi:glycosidase
MAPDHAARNVATQDADPASILALYRRLVWLRRELPALTGGAFQWHVRGHDGVLAYLREAPDDDGSPGRRVLVAIATGRAGGVVDLSTIPGRPVGLLSSLGPGVTPDLESGQLRLRALEAVLVRLD